MANMLSVRTVFTGLIALAAYSALPMCADPISEDATVTFYSHGSELTSGLPGSKHGVYFGAIYDGVEPLFWFRDGFFIKNNRYATFHLPPGHHAFSASYGKKPSTDHILSLDLKAHEHYFIRARSESSGIVVYEVEHGALDRVSCQVAQSEMAHAKPLSRKAISKAAMVSWLQSQTPAAACL